MFVGAGLDRSAPFNTPPLTILRVMSQFSELPSPPVCSDTGMMASNCRCLCCEKIYEEYATVKVQRTCSATTASDVIGSSLASNPKDDNTFDCILQALVVPAVGDNFQILVRNNSIYTVGQWIEFINVRAKYQIVALNNDNTLVLKNSNSDGVTPVDGNPSPGSSILINSCFVVIGSVDNSLQSDDIIELQNLISQSTSICLDSIPSPEQNELLRIVGYGAEVEGQTPQRKCLSAALETSPKVTNKSFKFDPSSTNGALRLTKDSEVGVKVGNELVFIKPFSTFSEGDGMVLNGSNQFEKAKVYRKWLLNQEDYFLGTSNSVQDIGSGGTYTKALTPPSVATHAIVKIGIFQERGLSCKVSDSNGKEIMRWFSPGGGDTDDDHSTSIEASVPIVNNEISITVASDDSATAVASVIGYERVETI